MTTRLANSSSLEQRGVIRFLLAESVKSCEILSRMQRQYGPSCMSRANFYKWVQAFKDGRESIIDDLRSGRPVDVSTPEAVQAVEDLIKSDRRVTLDEIATKLDISHGTVYAIVREKLHFSKVSCRWVPKMLTDDHKMQRLMASRASLRRYRKEGDAFLSRIVTTDETWVFHYEPESKRDFPRSDFHLFGPLKESMKGIHFQTDEEVKAAVSNWLRTQSTEFYAKGIDNLISRWNKCVAKEGDYVEK